ncbi:protein kinase-like domain, Concanavalin A-like lectin/glucanase domain protein [Artemisia annua]|uniref:Protein kinase-like domain, Concanavalin A-like lectin/glucanase domain protein n=1 Tax=Artemisia annua TaxID=35608 RepID=A0A2U1LZ09_ARTAN|nr:protein kinase-like domain, Concanavalin A-like lectin/glucanase domain protein [Artemisia annua]
MQGVEEWQAEVNFLERLSHPNLMKLLGYCYEGRGSTIEPLAWDIRLKIAIGAARGLVVFAHFR